MAVMVAALVSMVTAGLTLMNWRYGLFAVVGVGVLQDILRKLAPGAPAYFIIWSLALFLMVGAVALFRNRMGRFGTLSLGNGTLRLFWWLYLALIGFQAANSLARWQSPLVTGLGLVFYLGPIFALLLAVGYCRSSDALDRFVKLYLWIMVPAGLSVYLSVFVTDDLAILRDVGTFAGNQLLIYDVGTVLSSFSGVFRTGEIATWHAAMACCFLVVMGVRSKSTPFRVLAAVLVILLMGAIVLTGRRKMLLSVLIFGAVFIAFILFYLQHAKRAGMLFLVLGGIAFLSFPFFESGRTTGLYVERTVTVVEEIDDRLLLSWRLLNSAASRSEGIGLGIGVASLGARFVGGGGASSVGGSSEAGTGFLVVELGLWGAAIVVTLAVVFWMTVLRHLRALAKLNTDAFLMGAALTAIMVANIASFVISSLLFSDPFIQVMSGFMLGLLVAIIDAGRRAQRSLKSPAVEWQVPMRQAAA